MSKHNVKNKSGNLNSNEVGLNFTYKAIIGRQLTLCGPTNRLGCKNNLCCLVQTHVTHAFSLLPF